MWNSFHLITGGKDTPHQRWNLKYMFVDCPCNDHLLFSNYWACSALKFKCTHKCNDNKLNNQLKLQILKKNSTPVALKKLKDFKNLIPTQSYLFLKFKIVMLLLLQFAVFTVCHVTLSLYRKKICTWLLLCKWEGYNNSNFVSLLFMPVFFIRGSCKQVPVKRC